MSQLDLFGFEKIELKEEEKKYSRKVHSPIYTPTQNVDGGLSDLYKKYGTYVKSFYSVMLSPSSVVIKLMGHTSPRLHHKIDYKKTMPCIIDEKYKKI